MKTYLNKLVTTYAKVVAFAACLVLALLVGVAVFRMTRAQRLEHAFMEYQHLAQDVDYATEEALSALGQQANRLASEYAGTSASMMFHALAARVYGLLGDDDMVRQAMAAAQAAAAPYDRDMANLYATSSAVAGLHSTDLVVAQASKDALHQLAQDAANIHRAMASYYLGFDAFERQDADAAQEAWRVLFDAAGQPVDIWGQRVRLLREGMA